MKVATEFNEAFKELGSTVTAGETKIKKVISTLYYQNLLWKKQQKRRSKRVLKSSIS